MIFLCLCEATTASFPGPQPAFCCFFCWHIGEPENKAKTIADTGYRREKELRRIIWDPGGI